MRIRVVVSALAVLACVAGSDETKEPPQLLFLEVEGGQKVPIQIGKPFTVTIGANKVSMKLTERPYRIFDAGGVRFEYPRRFTFSYEKDVAATTWTVQGRHTLLMLQRFDKTDIKALLTKIEANLVGQFGPKTKRSDTTLKVGETELKGRRLDLDVGDKPIRQDWFGFAAGGATYAMMVQDSLTDDGKPTQEALGLIDLLRKTLKLK